MKTPLKAVEQENLKVKGIISRNEIAYREDNLIFAEDPISGDKRVIDALQVMKENKNVLLG